MTVICFHKPPVVQPCVLSAIIPDSTHKPIFACLYCSLCGIKQGRKSRGMTVGSFLVVQWKDSERGILRNSRPKQSLTLCFFVDK